jgi:putative protease
MSPAGYWPQLRAAIEAGADACYFGLKHFTARAKVGFDVAELPDVMRTLRQRGVRGYLTFNTLVFEHELDEAAKTIEKIAQAGVDALIIQDLGVLNLARQIAPDLELHASTQASITSAEGVEFAVRQGAHRVTLARELSLDEISTIYDRTRADLEIFVHGALCVAYSGQCFSSEAWGGRSANRGQCAQACRLPYELIVDGGVKPLDDARYLLSPGDLSAIHHVPAVIESGVSCLKIEGRYKDADYVTLTTRAYRQAVDSAWANQPGTVSKQTALELEQVYSRGLGPHFLTGVNHQAVVRGRHTRHRGVHIATVVDIQPNSIRVEPTEIHEIAPLKPGDGLVFDAASWRSPQESEEGGRVYHATPGLDGTLELTFANKAIDFTRIRKGDLVWRTHDPDLDRTIRPYLDATVPLAKQPVTVHAETLNNKLNLTWTLKAGQSVTVESPELKPAQNRALSHNSLSEQLSRLGQTPYELVELTTDLKINLFAPASTLNQLRRDAVDKLQALQATPPTRTIHAVGIRPVGQNSGLPKPTQLHLLVRNAEQLAAAIDLRPDTITLDYLDLYGLRPSVEKVKAAGLEPRVASPRILKPGESRIANFLQSLDCPILVRSTGLLHVLPKERLIGDFSLNTANSLTAHEYLKLGCERLTPTHDLNAAQIAKLATDIGAGHIEAVAYQHLPVFHTEHCVFCRFLSTGTTHRDCGRPCEKHLIAVRDQQGRAHPVIADVGCRNTVFGAEAQQAAAHLELWRAAGIHHFRLEFVHESAGEVRRVTTAFQSAFAGRTNYAQLANKLNQITPTTEGSLFVPKDYQLFPILQ